MLSVHKVRIILVYLLGEIMGLMLSSFRLLTLCFHVLKIALWYRSHARCYESTSQPWRFSGAPLPCWKPKRRVSCSVIFNHHSECSLSFSLALSSSFIQTLLRMCSLHGNVWYHYGTGGLACCRLLLYWIYCARSCTKHTQPAKCCQRAKWFSRTPLREIRDLFFVNILFLLQIILLFNSRIYKRSG